MDEGQHLLPVTLDEVRVRRGEFLARVLDTLEN